MATLLSIPIFILFVILQTTLASRLQLLHGNMDLILLVVIAWGIQERTKGTWLWALVAGLMVSQVSALPFFLVLFTYLAANGFVQLLRNRVWQTPILAMYFAVITTTLLQHFSTLVVLNLSGTIIPWSVSFNQVTLPSILLNMLMALPIYIIISDLAKWLYPKADV